MIQTIDIVMLDPPAKAPSAGGRQNPGLGLEVVLSATGLIHTLHKACRHSADAATLASQPSRESSAAETLKMTTGSTPAASVDGAKWGKHGH